MLWETASTALNARLLPPGAELDAGATQAVLSSFPLPSALQMRVCARAGRQASCRTLVCAWQAGRRPGSGVHPWAVKTCPTRCNAPRHQRLSPPPPTALHRRSRVRRKGQARKGQAVLQLGKPGDAALAALAAD
jgi:hypothetical protein